VVDKDWSFSKDSARRPSVNVISRKSSRPVTGVAALAPADVVDMVVTCSALAMKLTTELDEICNVYLALYHLPLWKEYCVCVGYRGLGWGWEC